MHIVGAPSFSKTFKIASDASPIQQDSDKDVQIMSCAEATSFTRLKTNYGVFFLHHGDKSGIFQDNFGDRRACSILALAVLNSFETYVHKHGEIKRFSPLINELRPTVRAATPPAQAQKLALAA